MFLKLWDIVSLVYWDTFDGARKPPLSPVMFFSSIRTHGQEKLKKFMEYFHDSVAWICIRFAQDLYTLPEILTNG